MDVILRPNIDLLLDLSFYWTLDRTFPGNSEYSYLMDPATRVVYAAETSPYQRNSRT